MHILIYEEFFQDGLPQYPALCRFLGIDDNWTPKQKVVNKGYIWRSVHMQSFLNTHYRTLVYPFARRCTSEAMRNRVKDLILKLNKKQLPAIDTKLRDELRQRLNGDVRQLETLLGRDLSQTWF
jgi:hypothetical protein